MVLVGGFLNLFEEMKRRHTFFVQVAFRPQSGGIYAMGSVQTGATLCPYWKKISLEFNFRYFADGKFAKFKFST